MEPVGNFSSISHNCIPAIVCSQHTWLVNRNRLCCYVSSHTFLITDLFVAYHTHLVKLNCFSSLGSTQIVHPSELYVVYRTHPHLAAPTVPQLVYARIAIAAGILFLLVANS